MLGNLYVSSVTVDSHFVVRRTISGWYMNTSALPNLIYSNSESNIAVVAQFRSLQVAGDAVRNSAVVAPPWIAVPVRLQTSGRRVRLWRGAHGLATTASRPRNFDGCRIGDRRRYNIQRLCSERSSTPPSRRPCDYSTTRSRTHASEQKGCRSSVPHRPPAITQSSRETGVTCS